MESVTNQAKKLNMIVITTLIAMTTIAAMMELSGYSFVKNNDVEAYEGRIQLLEFELEMSESDIVDKKEVIDHLISLPKDKGYIGLKGEYSIEYLKEYISQFTSNEDFINEASSFKMAGEESGIDAKFLIALSGTQTGWGSSRYAKDKNNMYAENNYKYHTKESSIIIGAMNLEERFYSKGVITVDEISKSDVYSFKTQQDRLMWVNDIESIMNTGVK